MNIQVASSIVYSKTVSINIIPVRSHQTIKEDMVGGTKTI